MEGPSISDLVDQIFFELTDETKKKNFERTLPKPDSK